MEHISDNKLKHMRSVAELMYQKSFELGFDEEKAKSMYVLGFVHDIGYSIAAENHSYLGSDMLEDTGFQYHYEVAHHGNPNPPTYTTNLMLLQYCDMRVMPNGDVVDFETRLEDIKNRYGERSKQYMNSREVIENIRHSILFEKLHGDK